MDSVVEKPYATLGKSRIASNKIQDYETLQENYTDWCIPDAFPFASNYPLYLGVDRHYFSMDGYTPYSAMIHPGIIPNEKMQYRGIYVWLKCLYTSHGKERMGDYKLIFKSNDPITDKNAAIELCKLWEIPFHVSEDWDSFVRDSLYRAASED